MAEIDLSKYHLHTDLIIEDDNITHHEEVIDGVNIKTTKKDGNYITISFDDVTDTTNREKVSHVLELKINELLKLNHISKTDSCLVIGLGNYKSTPDSLGVKSLEDIIVTSHMYELGSVSKGYRKVSVFTPGVMSQTGIESFDIISSIIEKIKPDFVIAIDALASLSLERINKTIQLTDTGIHPGQGVGNNRKEISKNTIGIPVIAIGIPTVVLSETIVIDTINYLYKHIAYIKEYEGINNLSVYKTNYLNKIKNKDLSRKEKEELLGLFGSLDEIDKRNLISEVLNDTNLNLIVSPSEIDFIIDKLANIIAISINKSLHPDINSF